MAETCWSGFNHFNGDSTSLFRIHIHHQVLKNINNCNILIVQAVSKQTRPTVFHLKSITYMHLRKHVLICISLRYYINVFSLKKSDGTGLSKESTK